MKNRDNEIDEQTQGPLPLVGLKCFSDGCWMGKCLSEPAGG